MLVNDDEREDFENAIKNLRLDVDDFLLEEQEEASKTADIHAVAGKVTITRVSNQKSRTYNAGHGTSWPEAFERDLNAGLFK